MTKISIGLDIGTTSVGYSVLNGQNEILLAGVRLFEDVASSKDGKLLNDDRRTFRHQRRQIFRKKYRKAKFVNLVLKYQFYASKKELFEVLNEPNLRIKTILKGLKEPLTKNELIQVLYYYLTHRGFNYNPIENEDVSIKPTTKEWYDYYLKYDTTKNAPTTLNFSHVDKLKELKQLLNCQNVDESFKEKYLKIFSSFKQFNLGPGDILHPSKFGLYQLKNNKIMKIGDNLWDAKIGKCSVFSNENRSLKNNPTYLLFNLFNDLNNLSINDTFKLTKEQKLMWFNFVNENLNKDKKVNLTLNNLKKILKLNASDTITGFRINPKNEPIFSELKNYYVLLLFLKANNVIQEIDVLNHEQLTLCSNLFNIIAKHIFDKKEVVIVVNNLLNLSLKDEIILDLIKNLNGFSEAGKLSLKALNEYFKVALDNNINASTYFYNLLQKNNKTTSSNTQFLPPLKDEDLYVSPTTKRSLRQCVKVINALLTKFDYRNYELTTISIETTRAINSAQERREYNSSLKQKQKIKDEIFKLTGFNLDGIYKNEGNLYQKLLLWYEQEGIDLYDKDFKQINIRDLYNNPHHYNIDHIIPRKISADSSMSNLILTSNITNHTKSNTTPFMAFSNDAIHWENFKKKVINNKRFSYTKKQNLLYESDPIKHQSDFINRQLNDTSTIAVYFLKYLRDFFDNSSIYHTKINTIKGSLTHYSLTKILKLTKNRDLYFHHAVDSIIINYLGANSKLQKVLTSFFKYDKISNLYVKKGDETFDGLELDLKSDEKLKLLKTQITSYIKNDLFLYSRMKLDKNKMNFYDATLYKYEKIDDQSGVLYTNLKLLDANTSKDTLDVYFNSDETHPKIAEKLKKLVIYTKNKPLFDTLKNLYQQIENEILIFNQNNEFKISLKTTNYFLWWCKQNDKLFLDINGLKIKKLKLVDTFKKPKHLVVFANHQNKKAIYQSLNALNYRIYKDRNGSLKTIAININVLKYDGSEYVIDKNKLNHVLKIKNIDMNAKYLTIYNGTMFMLKDDNVGDSTDAKLLYSNGGGSLDVNTITFHSLMSNDVYKINDEEIKYRLSYKTNTFVNKYDLVYTNVLGEIRQKINLKKYFEIE